MGTWRPPGPERRPRGTGSRSAPPGNWTMEPGGRRALAWAEKHHQRPLLRGVQQRANNVWVFLFLCNKGVFSWHLLGGRSC